MTILRPDDRLFFANVGRLAAAVDAELAGTERTGDALVLDLAATFEPRSDVLAAIGEIRGKVEGAGRRLVLVDESTTLDATVEAAR